MTQVKGELSQNLTFHVGSAEDLLERAARTPQPTELLLAPVELHRRNVQRRLREAQSPKDAFEFADAAGAASRVLEAADAPTDSVDRIDRLSALGSLLDDALDVPAGASGVDGPRAVEQLRTEVESVTNFHPERVAAVRGAADELASPVDRDAAERVDLAVDVERALRAATSDPVSDVELVRRGTRRIAGTGGDAWRAAYSGISRVSLLGVSSVSATQADLLHALLDATDVDVHVYARRGTGEYLRERVPELLDVAAAGEVVFE